MPIPGGGSVCSGPSLTAHWFQEVGQEQPQASQERQPLDSEDEQPEEGSLGLPGPRPSVISPILKFKAWVATCLCRPGPGPHRQELLGDPCPPPFISPL